MLKDVCSHIMTLCTCTSKSVLHFEIHKQQTSELDMFVIPLPCGSKIATCYLYVDVNLFN